MLVHINIIDFFIFSSACNLFLFFYFILFCSCCICVIWWFVSQKTYRIPPNTGIL